MPRSAVFTYDQFSFDAFADKMDEPVFDRDGQPVMDGDEQRTKEKQIIGLVFFTENNEAHRFLLGPEAIPDVVARLAQHLTPSQRKTIAAQLGEAQAVPRSTQGRKRATRKRSTGKRLSTARR